MTYFRGYITRSNKEYEVTAKLFDEGHYETGYESDTGYYLDILFDPVWEDFTCFDEHGVEIDLTNGEMHHVTEQLNKEYWDSVLT